MSYKKISQDPFSNGTEHMIWESYNCERCVKDSKLKKDGSYTYADEHNMPNRCAILRDIYVRMFSDEPIAERTVKICNDFTMRGKTCPYLRTTWPKKRGRNLSKGQLELGL